MAILEFPVSPVNGQVYPSSPLVGQNVYYWDASFQTWRLIGAATGVVPGTYGSANTVGRFTVDYAGRISFAESVAIQIESPAIVINPPINGITNLQTLLEGAIYDVSSTNLTVTESATGLVSVNLPNTGVSSGSYTYGSFTVDPQGRITSAASGISPNTSVTFPITNTGTNVEPIIGIEPSSVSQPGAVQLNDTLTSTATDQALTAAQGKVLQDQINSLVISGSLAYSGTFDAANGQMVTVTIVGSDAGFVVGQNIPAPSPTVLDHFVIISTGGTYTPPGGSPLILSQGDWLFCNGLAWVLVNLGPKLPYASTTSPGAVELATSLETQTGVDGSRVVTPLGLSSRVATESATGLTEIATQSEVNTGVDDFKYVTPLKLSNYISGGGGNTPASGVVVSPAINGNTNVQGALEDAIYSIISSNLTIGESATGNVTITLPNTSVTAGSYSYASFTVDSQGRLTAAASGETPTTTVISPLLNSGTLAQPVISIQPSSTTQPGAVQLANTRSSTSDTLALTAAQGKILQDQINVLSVAGSLAYAGTFDAATGVMETVTLVGIDAGFAPGVDVPPPSNLTLDHFVIVTIPGNYTPPGGGGPFDLEQGDWLFCNGINWVQVQLGSRLPYASETSPGVVEFATSTETQTGTDNTLAVTPFGLQSKVSDSVSTTSSTTIASSTAVKASYDIASAAIPCATLAGKGDILTATGAAAPLALPVGANGQVLSADSATTSGLTWIVPCSGTVTQVNTGTGLTGGPITTTGTIALANTSVVAGAYTYADITVDAQGRLTSAASGAPPILCSTVSARGDLIVGSAPNAPVALPVGSDGQVLSVNSAAADGVSWTTLPDPPVYAIQNLDDISSLFDGVTTSFSLEIAGVAYTPVPDSNIAVFLGGVPQTPGAANAYTVSGFTINFSSPPPAGTNFYAFTVALV